MAMNARNAGIAAGIVWGFACFITGLLANTGIGLGFVNVMASIYIGYQPGILGAILGLIYGFCDGFTGGFAVSWFYNKLEKK